MIFKNKGHIIDVSSIPQRLRFAIMELDISVREAASRCKGVSQPSLHHYCKGTRSLSIEVAAQICKDLDIDFIWLITGLKSNYRL